MKKKDVENLLARSGIEHAMRVTFTMHDYEVWTYVTDEHGNKVVDKNKRGEASARVQCNRYLYEEDK